MKSFALSAVLLPLSLSLGPAIAQPDEPSLNWWRTVGRREAIKLLGEIDKMSLEINGEEARIDGYGKRCMDWNDANACEMKDQAISRSSYLREQQKLLKRRLCVVEGRSPCP